MNVNLQLFRQRYEQLNTAQQQAVNTIYGPVMVIAGPGTGKTEVLSMRIANLLLSDAQVTPAEILCLTYTEEAAFNMRKRLLQIVGQDAHKVNIHTFHGFCNNVIQNNVEYFGVRSLDVVSDLERIELMQDMIGKLPPDHPMHRVGSSIYYDIQPLLSFFNEMKKENWSEEAISEAVQAYIDSLPSREQYVYKRNSGNNKKGDLKEKDIEAETERMQRTIAAAALFSAYNEAMKGIGRYDFSDMILWVIQAFKQHPYLLQFYQERFQFILVDEFQDTNGAQNELLSLLTSYWDEPNIFVVGDDDQSIYEFQGARIRNIVDFYEKYRRSVQIILLTENYRSSQPILDKAVQSIEQNKQRLVNAIQGVSFDKNIRAALPRFAEEASPVPVVTAYYNIIHEEIAIVRQIEELQAAGADLSQAAVIYAQHKQADNIIALMERKGIPYSIRRNVNALELILPQQLLRLFTYLNEENKKPFSAEHLLFELLHAPYFNIDPADLAALSIYLNSKEAREQNIRHWRQLLSHELRLSNMELKTLPAIMKISRNLDYWLQQLRVLTLPMLLEKVVYDSGIVAWLLQGDEPVWQMQVLQTLFDFVRSVSAGKPQMSPDEFLQIIEKMRSEHIALPVQRIVQQQKGVQFYTAHSAKGNEFEYVFMIGCTKDFWEDKKGVRGLKLPDTLTRTVDENDSDYKIEVARRLFYVGMTRAKKYLYLSYAQQKNDGKPLQASMFIDEICAPEERRNEAVETPELIEVLAQAMQPVAQVYIRLTNRELILKRLENFALSASALNKYLDCPVRFYYEDVVQTPVAENDSMAFGTAIHYALERAFVVMNRSADKQFPQLDEVLSYFRFKMRDKEQAFTKVQYERRLNKGITILTDYYQARVAGWIKDVELEKWLTAVVSDVPIKGKVDKIELTDAMYCRVVDYKTGNPDSIRNRDNLAAPNAKNPLGGNYWRQMVFYKLLVEHQPFNRRIVNEGVFEYIEKSEKNLDYGHKVFMLPDDEQTVLQQMKESYTRIRNLEFEHGCGKEDCPWCAFARNNQLVLPQRQDDDN